MSLIEIVKELFHEKTRMLLTILAIAFGTFAIASMLSIGEGLRLTFSQTVANAGYNLLEFTGGSTSRQYLGTHANVDVKLIKADLDAISHLPNVASISPQYDFAGKLRYGNKTTVTKVKAVSSDYAPIHQLQMLQGGRFITAVDLQKRSTVIVLGDKTRNELFNPNEEPIGKFIYIGNQPFQVIGAAGKKPQMFAAEEPDNYLNWMPVTTYELLANPTTIDAISITYKDANLLPKTKEEILSIVGLNHGINPSDEDIIDFSDLARMQKTINDFFVGMQIFLGIIGTLTLLVAGVGIANVMYASVNRATHEIGLRMALGARTWNILWRYIAESLSATIIGGTFGLLMSMLLVHAMQNIPMRGRLFDFIGQPKPILSFLVTTIVISILGIIGFLAGLFPALKAAKIDPAKALVYE